MIRLALLAWLVLVLPSAADPLAKTLFGAQTQGSRQAPEVFGGYAAGCVAGAVELAETGPGWQAMRLSRNRNWGHPETTAFVERLAPKAQAAGVPRLLIGDLSQPRGGPMTSLHASHQNGLDVDIWFRFGPAEPMSRQEREDLAFQSIVTDDRLDVNDRWTGGHLAMLRAAAQDPAVARIFVNPAIKAHLCRVATAPRDWLAKVRPWWGHDGHFHVRLGCPDGDAGCAPQAPPPAGEGCGDALDWWFTEDALNPAPYDGPRKRDVMTMADLPAACRSVLDAP
ncbi:MAG: penicillin-insensitive murein endopeptidase [Pseudomonadota bacterium]